MYIEENTHYTAYYVLPRGTRINYFRCIRFDDDDDDDDDDDKVMVNNERKKNKNKSTNAEKILHLVQLPT